MSRTPALGNRGCAPHWPWAPFFSDLPGLQKYVSRLTTESVSIGDPVALAYEAPFAATDAVLAEVNVYLYVCSNSKL